jgi:predicted DNA-binding transcriptional regulator AlpA
MIDTIQIPDPLANGSGQEAANRKSAGQPAGPELAQERPAKIESLLIPDTVAAALAGIGRSTWWRLHGAGKTPAGIKVGRSVKWNKAEIVAWIEARCPDRRTWEARRKARRN